MIRLACFLTLAILTIIAGCGKESSTGQPPAGELARAPSRSPYVVMDESLDLLKADFNADIGKVRQLFIVGPTCGICLRGMADLNDEYIAGLQHDNRLVTYVVHVPTLGAREEHMAATIPLLDGPNVHHYWEDSGIIGDRYREAMDTDLYMWDVWFIYGPEARWDSALPPKPEFFQHQLGPLPVELRLDKKTFASAARGFLERLPEETQEAAPAESNAERLADGTVIPVVAQPRGVAIQQHIMGRGGYHQLKRIQSIEFSGSIQIGESRFPLRIGTERRGRIERVIDFAGGSSAARRVDGLVTLGGAAGDRGLDWALEQQLLSDFDFDGALVEWPDKGHRIEMLGMRKLADVLGWELDLIEHSGKHWRLLVDSHNGNIARATLLDDSGQPRLLMDSADVREVDGALLPHRIEYRDPNGRTLAIERFDRIEVRAEPFEIDKQSVTH